MKVSHNLVRASRIMAWLSLLGAAAYLAAEFLVFLTPGLWRQLGAIEIHHTGGDITSAIPLDYRIAALAVELIPAALNTLRYVDCALLARRITARCLLSVGLMDPICPPSTVFAAYNEIISGKEISVHPFSDHDVPTAHAERQLRHFRDFLLGADQPG